MLVEPTAVVVFAVLVAILWGLSAVNYLIFHTVAELFAIVVAFMSFGVAWYSRTWIGANFLLMLGVGYLFVGSVDVVHMLAYKGVNMIPGATPDTPVQFWMAGRFMEATAFLVAVRWPLAKFSLPRVLSGYSGALAALIAVIALGLFPTTFIEGKGLTAFKVGGEYVVMAGYAVAFELLRRNPTNFDPMVRRLLMTSLVVKVLAELSFTLYVDVYGLFNFVGHVFKLLSYYLVMRAIVETGLKRPQALIFGSLEREKLLADELQHHATTLDAVLDASLDPVVMIDRQGCFRFVSRAGEHFFDRSGEQLSGRTWRELGLSATIMTPIEDLCERVLANGEPVTEEYRVPGVNGERCLEAQVAPVRSGDGPVSAVVAVIRDITARKAMEEELKSSLDDNRVLMMEVHHRVKNNLQIVSSLLQMQGWRVADPPIRAHFEEACGRILSLAKVHEMLYKEENVAAVDFVGYVRTLCDELFKMYSVREDWVTLRFDGGSLVLGLDKAVPLALIVHELVTNAVKHAFTEQGGELRLTVTTEGDATGVLRVADDGKGPSDTILREQGGSLGMQMVSVLVKQMHGSVTESHDFGTEITIRFPLAEAPVVM